MSKIARILSRLMWMAESFKKISQQISHKKGLCNE